VETRSAHPKISKKHDNLNCIEKNAGGEGKEKRAGGEEGERMKQEGGDWFREKTTTRREREKKESNQNHGIRIGKVTLPHPSELEGEDRSLKEEETGGSGSVRRGSLLVWLNGTRREKGGTRAGGTAGEEKDV